MAAFVGKAGKIDWDGTLLVGDVNLVTDWTLNTSLDVVEVKLMGCDWVKRFAGFTDFTLSATVMWPDETDPSSFVGASATLDAYIDADSYFSGTAICNAWSPAAAIDGMMQATFSFQGSEVAGDMLTLN